jgi:mono/diheme cytochrome c family protein
MRERVVLAVGLVAAALAGCRQDMHDQQKFEPLEATPFFGDGRSARRPVEGTVARGLLHDDRLLYEGIDPDTNELAAIFPMKVTKDVLSRGRERFDIFCAPCHGAGGDGDGIVVQRGMPRPPSYHDPRLVAAPDAHFVDVITNGHGAMYSYADRVPPSDRWAIAAYIRAFQRSRDERIDAVPPAARAKLLAEAAR